MTIIMIVNIVVVHNNMHIETQDMLYWNGIEYCSPFCHLGLQLLHMSSMLDSCTLQHHGGWQRPTNGLVPPCQVVLHAKQQCRIRYLCHWLAS